MSFFSEILVTIYCMNPYFIAMIAVLVGICWSVLFTYLNEKHEKTTVTVNGFILLLMIIIIVCSTIADRGNSYVDTIYLQPFHTFSAAKQQPELYRATFMNVVLFYPLGLTLGCMIHKKGWHHVLLSFCIVALLSTCIECWQYIAKIGEGDIDDVIFNTLGTVLGYGIAILGQYIYYSMLSKHKADHGK